MAQQKQREPGGIAAAPQHAGGDPACRFFASVFSNAGDGRAVAAARVSHVTASIRVYLTSRMVSGNGPGYRGSDITFIERPQEIDRSYAIEKGPLSSAL
ncbi:MAG: hypothetical protein WBV25_12685 [Methylocella sp.]